MADTKGWVVDPANPNRATFLAPDGRTYEAIKGDKTGPRLVPEAQDPPKVNTEGNDIAQRGEGLTNLFLNGTDPEHPREWGIGEDASKAISGDTTPIQEFQKGNIPTAIGSLLRHGASDVANVGAGALQGLTAGAETMAADADMKLHDVGIPQALEYLAGKVGLGGNKVSVLDAVQGLNEAFPEGGLSHGFTTPKGDVLAPEARDKLNKQADALLQKPGVTREDFDAFTEANGLKPYGKELDDVLAAKDRINDNEAEFKFSDPLSPENLDKLAAKLDRHKRVVANNDPNLPPEGGAKGASFSTDQTLDRYVKTDEEGPTSSVNNNPDPSQPSVVERLTDALKTANKTSEEQKALYTEERSNRLKKVAEARNTTTGEEGLHAELGALKGELPKAEFQGVRDQFSQEDLTGLFDQIKNHPGFGKSLFDPINARLGLAKLLDGQVPAPKQLDLLGEVFPPDFIKEALKHRSDGSKALDFMGNALNLPRALMSTFDLSAPLRQGVNLIGRKEWWNSFGSMFKQFGSQKAFDAVAADIKGRDSFPLMEDSGLSLTNLAGKTADLTAREEAFTSEWAEKLPVLGHGVKASERAYVGFLNKLRADTFDGIINDYAKAGIDVTQDTDKMKGIATYINNATGRGELGNFTKAGPLINSTFFSPKLIASRVNMMNPVNYVKMDPVLRKRAVSDLLRFGGIASTTLGLAAAGGLDVEDDPRSSDFAKIKTGNTRYDILGGYGQYLTLGARLLSNEKKTIKGDIMEYGKKRGDDTRLDALINFGLNKGSPIATFVADYLRGKDAVGQPFELKKEVASRFVPLFLQDLNDVVKERGAVGVPMAAPGLFGVGVQTYNVPDTRDALGRKDSEHEGVDKDPAAQEIIRLEKSMKNPLVSAPPKSIPDGKLPTGEANNRKLTDEEYDKYAHLSGYYLSEILKGQIKTDDWKKMDAIAQRKEVQKIAAFARKSAREQLFKNVEEPQPQEGQE